jgi:hypothetical protein
MQLQRSWALIFVACLSVLSTVSAHPGHSGMHVVGTHLEPMAVLNGGILLGLVLIGLSAWTVRGWTGR